jgi:Kef-type K+ transport system membrane component KefB
MPATLLLLVQIGIIVLVARATGRLFRLFRQPQVVGEIVAGILLGPSLLGWTLPGVSAMLFPPESLSAIAALSQLGLIIFMFLVGLELDLTSLRERGGQALVISHASIAVPFALGATLAWPLFARVGPEDVKFLHFALFMGGAMSVTAFPVLARILADRKLLRTRLGSMAIACAAVDDVTAWCILAFVVLLVRADEHALPLWLTIGGTLAFVGVAIGIVRPRLAGLAGRMRREGSLTQDVLATVLVLVLACAVITEWLGIHALFGAFLAGALLPKDEDFVAALMGKLQDLTVVLLLPLFFAFTGLRTSLGLVSGIELWGWTLAVLFVAVAGKIGGTMAAARVTGSDWREAGALGVLMNTRGLMELVILNVGLDLGVINYTVFSMMVIMAVTTTFMTSPLLDRLVPASPTPAPPTAPRDRSSDRFARPRP